MEQTNPAYTVVEVAIKLKDMNDATLLGKAISTYLEDCGEGGSEHTEVLDQVNYFGEWENEECLVSFLAPGHDFLLVKNAVKGFMDELKVELHDEDLFEDWIVDLESEHIPSFDSYRILTTRKYDW